MFITILQPGQPPLKIEGVALIDPQTGAPLGADSPLPVAAGRVIVVPSPAMTRPNDTTAYAAGDLMANSTTAGSVVPLEFDVGGGSGMVRKIRWRTNRASGATTNASFRVYLFRTTPTVAGGDNAAFNPANSANYLGAMDVSVTDQFSDGGVGNGLPMVGSEISYSLPDGSTKLYGLVRVGGSYAPAAQEQITLALEIIKDSI